MSNLRTIFFFKSSPITQRPRAITEYNVRGWLLALAWSARNDSSLFCAAPSSRDPEYCQASNLSILQSRCPRNFSTFVGSRYSVSRHCNTTYKLASNLTYPFEISATLEFDVLCRSLFATCEQLPPRPVSLLSCLKILHLHLLFSCRTFCPTTRVAYPSSANYFRTNVRWPTVIRSAADCWKHSIL
jgi:hypothetical protein